MKAWAWEIVSQEARERVFIVWLARSLTVNGGTFGGTFSAEIRGQGSYAMRAQSRSLDIYPTRIKWVF